MKKQEFVKFITDWVWYERILQQMEQVGFNLTPEHPMWKMSDRYAELISEKFSVSVEQLKESLEPLFIEQNVFDMEGCINNIASIFCE